MTKRARGMDAEQDQERGRRALGRRPRSDGMTPRAVIFDLDGTLADSLLDFDAIRAEIGLAPGLPILEQLAGVDPAARARAELIMRRHEREAIASATLTDGCADLLGHLGALGNPDRES